MSERKSAGLDVAWSQEPAAVLPATGELAKLAADPVAFVEAMPAVKRGSARRALNLDVPGELGDWFTHYCRDAEVSQRDVLRALLSALRADVAQG